MLTDYFIGDRVKVTIGDHSGETGTIDAPSNGACVGVNLDDAGGLIYIDTDRLEREPTAADNVNHPKHYTSHPSGVEVIEITEHMGFCLGNAVKYILRSDLKGNAIEDLKKAAWYINREIEKREAS